MKLLASLILIFVLGTPVVYGQAMILHNDDIAMFPEVIIADGAADKKFNQIGKSITSANNALASMAETINSQNAEIESLKERVKKLETVSEKQASKLNK